MFHKFLIFNFAFFILFVAQVEAAPFTDNGDGTVKDNATGLIWQKCSQGQNTDATCSGAATTSTWSASLTNCSGLGLAGRTWRLPGIQELKTIVDTTTTASAKIDSIAFPNTQTANYYWSSTTYAPGTTNAWAVNFTNGNGPRQ